MASVGVVGLRQRLIMNLRLPLIAVIALLSPVVFSGCSLARMAAPADKVKIANIEVGPGRSANFVVFRVTVDYKLASQPEALVGLDLALGDEEQLRPVVERHVTQGSGTVQLLAECERSRSGKQHLQVTMSAFPRTLPLALLTSRSRTIALPR